jgi:carboxypeptidase D
MNPDGFALARRSNANALDLNRNFPDRFQMTTGSRQPETDAVMRWSQGRNFV